MRLNIIRYIIILTSFSFAYGYSFLDITQYGYEQYQDIIINNTVVKKATNNHCDCDTRYHIIQQVLNQYQRPFTMLDIGASQGYYTFRACHDYHMVGVMIEGNNHAYPMIGDQILDLCTANNMDNVVLLNKKIEVPDLVHLSECEHFDVVLLLNIAHWFGNEWKTLLDAVFAVGDNIIIETPPQEAFCSNEENQKRKNIEDYIKAHNCSIIGSVPRHTSNTFSTMYLISQKNKFLRRKTWFTEPLKGNTHKVVSDFCEKYLTKQPDFHPDTFLTTPWEPGINLITFKMYQGSYPTKETIKQEISKLVTVASNDWMPNNMIVQGKSVAMIDTNDPNQAPGGRGGGRRYSHQFMEKVLELIDIDQPAEFLKAFWQKLVQTSPPKY